jgi:ABC-type transporter Mla MlaB component
MLKIDRIPSHEGALALTLAGEIRGPWVEELRRVAEGAVACGATVHIDLAEVSFVDRPGIALLNHLAEGRVTLANCSPFVTELLRVRS